MQESMEVDNKDLEKKKSFKEKKGKTSGGEGSVLGTSDRWSPRADGKKYTGGALDESTGDPQKKENKGGTDKEKRLQKIKKRCTVLDEARGHSGRAGRKADWKGEKGKEKDEIALMTGSEKNRRTEKIGG